MVSLSVEPAVLSRVSAVIAIQSEFPHPNPLPRVSGKALMIDGEIQPKTSNVQVMSEITPRLISADPLGGVTYENVQGI